MGQDYLEEERYKMMHDWSGREFRLEDFNPHEDECRYLILKIVEQAVRDYLALEESVAPIEKFHYSTAQDLIFNDDYRIQYGDSELTFQDMLGLLDIEIAWFRDRVAKLKRLKIREVNLKLKPKKK